MEQGWQSRQADCTLERESTNLRRVDRQRAVQTAESQTIWGRMWTSLPPFDIFNMYYVSLFWFICV